MNNDDPKKLLLGIILVIWAGVLLATMDALSKQLTGSFDTVQVLWGRYFFHTLIIFVVLSRKLDFSFLKSRQPYLQLRRSIMLIGATATMYLSLRYIPLANATSIQFFAPVLVTVFAGLFLGEKVGIHRQLAAMIGFCGVLVIMQPGVGDFNFYALLPLATAFMLATYLLMTRQLIGKDDERCTQFYATAIGSVLLSFIVPWIWTPPTGIEFCMMVAQGSLGALGHFLILRAFQFAPASLLSPFLYSQLLAATVWSVFYFEDEPSSGLLIGATILVGSGLYIWWRERNKKLAKS